jgi:predicted GIY-YIG superfamily endonuclease
MQSKDLHFCMQDRKTYAVYILASRSLNFYIGVTSNLHKRVWQHNSSRETTQGLDSRQENCAHQIPESYLARSE